MGKIKVLHLITHLGFGGASDNTLLTVERLPRRRYEVHLAAGADYLDWVDRGRAGADAFFLFPELYRDPNPAADLRTLQRLKAFVREQRYDIVHTHNAKAGILGRIAAHWAATPILLHTFHLLSWQDAMTTETGLRSQLSATLKSRFYLFLEKYAASLSDKIVTVCQENRQEAIAAGLASAEKIMTIYSGIDVEGLQSSAERVAVCAELGLNPEQPIVGMIGRLSPQKAPLDFVQAAKLVLQQRSDVQFILVGDGPLAAEVEAAIGNEARIKMLGYRNDVPAILRILDLFALASLWEGLGRAMTEAMLMGIPVVATAVNGIPELVTHGETGLLSPPHAPDQLAANLLYLLANPAEAQRMSTQAKLRVAPQFGADQMITQIADLYEQLLAAKGYSTARPALTLTPATDLTSKTV